MLTKSTWIIFALAYSVEVGILFNSWYKGEITGILFFKNCAIKGASTIVGTIGGSGGAALGASLGTFLCPGVGTVVGGIIGGFIAGFGTGYLTEKVLNHFFITDDVLNKMENE